MLSYRCCQTSEEVAPFSDIGAMKRWLPVCNAARASSAHHTWTCVSYFELVGVRVSSSRAAQATRVPIGEKAIQPEKDIQRSRTKSNYRPLCARTKESLCNDSLPVKC